MPAIRRHVYIAASQRTVWRALTTAEGLASWLVDEARVDPRNGGRIVWTYEGDDGEPINDIGTILKWRPTSHLPQVKMLCAPRAGTAETRAALEEACEHESPTPCAHGRARARKTKSARAGA